VQLQAEDIGSEAVAAQAVRGKTILEFFNAVLTFPAIVIEGKNGPAAAFQVGDQKTQVSAFVLGLVTDAPLDETSCERARESWKRIAAAGRFDDTVSRDDAAGVALSPAIVGWQLCRSHTGCRKTRRIHRAAAGRIRCQRAVLTPGRVSRMAHLVVRSTLDSGFSLNVGLEYIATTHFSAEGIFGYHHFPAQAGSALDAYQFSANGKDYLTSSSALRPFINTGIE
jgi:hypothetical protein